MSFITTEHSAPARQQTGEFAVRLTSPQEHAIAGSSLHSASSSTSSAAASAHTAHRLQPHRKPAMPRHPIPSMQEAFAESLAEATAGTLSLKPKLSVDTPQVRRERLIDQDKSEGPPAALWRYRPGQNCHELRKLLAQIAFGVYLLLKGMANSNAQVVAILQGHIDEVDDYLRTAMDDLQLAQQDLTTRLEHLRLPLENLPAFEEMLEDRAFRLRIVEGNVRIEHILSRTSTALAQTVQDINEGLGSAKEFNAYLESEAGGPWKANQDVAEIFEAMRGNADGWLNAFVDLQDKSHALDVLIAKLADMVTEMDRCAGEVSRRTRFSIQPFSLPQEGRHESRLSRVSQASFESSNASSHETTPPGSPSIQVPQLPPRLSLRLSTLDTGSDFLGLDTGSSLFGSGSLFGSSEPVREEKPAETVVEPKEAKAETPKEPERVAEPERKQKQPELEPELEQSPVEESDEDTTLEISLPIEMNTVDSPKNPVAKPNEPRFAVRQDSKRANTPISLVPGIRQSDGIETSWLMSPDRDSYMKLDDKRYDPIAEKKEKDKAKEDKVKEDKAKEDKDRTEEDKPEELYILQPRTYTPQPLPPLPSPMVRDAERNISTTSLPIIRAPEGESGSPRASARRVERPMSHRVPSPAAMHGEAKQVLIRSIPYRAVQDVERRPETASSVTSPSISSMGSPVQVQTPDTEGTQPRHRTSIRERVSLRTSPPEAIQVPGPNAPALQRPVFASPQTYQSYKTFTGPDSAYGAEAQQAGRSFMEAPYAPPPVPGLIPSPHSEHQFFRPVLASPHSPLQQRPYTAGQVQPRPSHLRSPPSTMGMSMLSSVTTMTNGEGGHTLKKKRSALGWLKKAFTLDEDERANFDQRKNQAAQNGYYENRGPKFLDGRRIR